MLLWLLITSLRNFNFGRPISKDLGLSLDYSQLLFAFSGPAPATRLIFYHILNLDCSVTNAGPYVCLIFSSVWKKFDFPYVQHSNLSVCGLFFSSDGLSETKTPQLHAAPAAEGLRPLTSAFGGTHSPCSGDLQDRDLRLPGMSELGREGRERSRCFKWNHVGFAHCHLHFVSAFARTVIPMIYTQWLSRFEW